MILIWGNDAFSKVEELKRSNFLDLYAVYITDGDVDNLMAHCKSADDDLGDKKLTPNQYFHWKFRQNVILTTVFTCTYRWMAPDDTELKSVTFNAFDIEISILCGDKYSINRCYWLAIDGASHDKATVFKVKALEVVDKTIRQLARLLYLKEHKHPKHEAKLRSHISKLKWQTSKNHVDYRVFVMLHMESYIGDPIAKWDVGLFEESKEQVLLLRRMRIIYDLPGSGMEEVAGRGGRRKEVAGRGGRRTKVTGHGAHRKKVAGRGGKQKKVIGKGGRHEEGVWSVEPDLFRSGGCRWKKVEEESP
nr:plant self-incompatibility protein S1 family [Tanacetum cinerariifolium]